ncbi:MAG: hypothetical protein HY538_00370 [Deltaproteobacteria bacterium]|nr:hypothetical protein [Deltaproteobacteria bacterium]
MEEAQNRLRLKRENVLAILGYLQRQKRVLCLTPGLYALWHPSERKWGIHPFPILDALMRFRQSPYYVGLLSAADHYGATHQKPQRLQVILPKQLKFRKGERLGLDFHVRKEFPTGGIVDVHSSSGKVAFSSPEWTALDLLYFQSASAGFDNVCLVIRDLIPCLTVPNLKQMVRIYPNPSSIQRLGYLLKALKADSKLVQPLKKWVEKNRPIAVALTPTYPKKGRVDSFWRVLLNRKVNLRYDR